MDHSQHHGAEDDAHAKWMRRLTIGTALVTGAVVLSPYILPAVGLGSTDVALSIMNNAMPHVGLGTGIAGSINYALNAIPVVGATLAKGGIASALTIGGVGIGGMLLGHYIEKKRDGTQGVNWGRVIRHAALATSILIALPSLLSGIGLGITYLTAEIGGMEAAGAALGFFKATLGFAAMDMTAAGTGLAALLPHFLICGGAILPAMGALAFWKRGGARTKPLESSAAESSNAVPQYTDGSIKADIILDKPLEKGNRCGGKLILTRSDTGQPLSDSELAVVHTRKIHLFVVDESLKDYVHIHPEPTATPGVFSFSFAPSTDHSYTAWADCTLLENGMNHKLRVNLPSPSHHHAVPVIGRNNTAAAQGLNFSWQASGPLRKGESAMVDVFVRDSAGNPVRDLEPVMGAHAHLVGFGADGVSIIHTHPLGKELASDKTPGGPELRFHMAPEQSGPIQFYLQVKRGGEDIYVPFGQQIEAPARHAARIIASQATHVHHQPSFAR